jgi:opacity protein-like surface antigen
MRKIAVLLFAGLFCTAISSATAADRYERYRDESPPPRGAEAPPPQHAVHGQPYFFGHLGLFEPNDSGSGLKGYDSGGSFDVGIGSRVSPNLAIEGTFGGYSADIGPNEVAVAPLTFGARLVFPSPFLEPYVGGGLGLYFSSLKEPASRIDDSDTTFGSYFSAGVDAWLNPRMALNFEGRYHWADPTFSGVDVKVGGWTVSMGIRVSY